MLALVEVCAVTVQLSMHTERCIGCNFRNNARRRNCLMQLGVYDRGSNAEDRRRCVADEPVHGLMTAHQPVLCAA